MRLNLNDDICSLQYICRENRGAKTRLSDNVKGRVSCGGRLGFVSCHDVHEKKEYIDMFVERERWNDE